MGKKTSRISKFGSLVLSSVVILGLLLSALFALLALVFVGNFNFSNNWHLFVFAYTFVAPVFSVIGFIAFHRSSRSTTKLSFLAAVFCTLATFIFWTIDSSRGLIH